MLKVGKWLSYSAIGVVAALVVLAWAGGAINWNHQPPYELVQSWGEKGSDQGQFNDPTGIAVSADEVFVSDARNNRIQVFDKQGRFKRVFASEQLARPMNLAIADGKLYVPDYSEDVVHVFTLDGEYERAIQPEDGFKSPGGVAARADGTVLVADTYAKRVVHIDAGGEPVRVWGAKAVGGEGGTAFSYPTDVALAEDGGFYVADGYNDRIQQFDSEGTLIRKWGGPFAMNIYGPFKGWFTTVSSVALGPNGAVFASDFHNDRIQKFNASGDFITAFAPDNFAGPGHSEIAVAVDADGTVFTANFKANRIEAWRPRPAN